MTDNRSGISPVSSSTMVRQVLATDLVSRAGTTMTPPPFIAGMWVVHEDQQLRADFAEVRPVHSEAKVHEIAETMDELQRDMIDATKITPAIMHAHAKGSLEIVDGANRYGPFDVTVAGAQPIDGVQD